MKKTSEILKINGFKRSGLNYDRDDCIQILYHQGEYTICFGNGETIIRNTTDGLIGCLALRGIINRLF